ncbi:CbiX/SirB N-terminal domain-containing protein [Kitasatospora sp. GAS204B]|uniref:sirohydrochlorin chelatase n=1 Tax=unclassified Kitasatospora TaxID=2633591 RepID=UPI0024759891|nr:CbiX/SirB N-terminal domain-containing protein [Kitasatospora sp. GAS204B]
MPPSTGTSTGTSTAAVPPASVLLVGGHESGAASRLRPLVEDAIAVSAVGVGRDLAAAVSQALAGSDRPVCVLPMTLGRDPRLVADAARTLRWLAGPAGQGRLALCDPFGSPAHLVGWLRAAAGRALGTEAAESSGPAETIGATGTDDAAVLVTAPVAGPFEDAELFRIARLVRQYRTHRWVEVAFEGGDPNLAEGVERCRRLGARRIVLLPAGFGPAPTVPGAEDGGPLLSARAVAGVLRARVAVALDRLRHGEDGIAAGLNAEHGHGFPHSHGPADGHAHPHAGTAHHH